MEVDGKKIAQQMQNFDSRLERLEESQEKGFKKVFDAISDLKIHKDETRSELLGNENYKRIGVVDQVQLNKTQIEELNDFKKKAIQLISLITAGISFLANALIYLLSKVL